MQAARTKSDPISLEWCAVLRPDAAPRPGIAMMFEVAFDVKIPWSLLLVAAGCSTSPWSAVTALGRTCSSIAKGLPALTAPPRYAGERLLSLLSEPISKGYLTSPGTAVLFDVRVLFY